MNVDFYPPNHISHKNVNVPLFREMNLVRCHIISNGLYDIFDTLA